MYMLFTICYLLATYSNSERTTTAANGTGSYTWASSSGYWSTQGGSSPQPNTSPAPYRTPPHAYPTPLEYAPAPPTSTAPTSAPAPLYPLQYESSTQHHSPYYQHAYPYAHHAIEDISYWPNSLNSYGYQPSEYVGSGEVPYSEGMSFGPSGPALEPAPGEDRSPPPAPEHPPEREYKFSTEEDRHSPCEETGQSRSPTQ